MINEEIFNSIDDFLEFISPWGNDAGLNGFIFRGHSKESYELIPAALRLQTSDQLWNMSGSGKPIHDQWNWQSWQISCEYNVLRSFYRLADQRGLDVPVSMRVRQNLAQEFDFEGFVGPREQDIWIPPDLQETAALAQHYGVPTRLLDWTYDIYVSLYFALRGAIGQDGNLAIWALNMEYLSFIKPTVKRINVEFITPHYSNNPNLNAQKGLFTLWPVMRQSMQQQMQSFTSGHGALLVDRRPLDQLILDDFVPEENFPIFRKFLIPCSEAKRGCQLLDKLGYDSSRVFPGYDGVASQLINRHKYY